MERVFLGWVIDLPHTAKGFTCWRRTTFVALVACGWVRRCWLRHTELPTRCHRGACHQSPPNVRGNAAVFLPHAAIPQLCCGQLRQGGLPAGALAPLRCHAASHGAAALGSPYHPLSVILGLVPRTHRTAGTKLLFCLTLLFLGLRPRAAAAARPTGRGACALEVPCGESWRCCFGLTVPPTQCHPRACPEDPSHGRDKALVLPHAAIPRQGYRAVPAGPRSSSSY